MRPHSICYAAALRSLESGHHSAANLAATKDSTFNRPAMTRQFYVQEFAKLWGSSSRQAKISIIDDDDIVAGASRMWKDFLTKGSLGESEQFSQELMSEISLREKQAGIVPDPDIDTYMKILGLDICTDTMVGDDMRRGVSGGQRKRLTTEEIIVCPINTLFMDEITNGLDISTTFQIVACLQQLVHITDATIVVSRKESNCRLRPGDRMVPPFEPLAITFQDVNYYVDTPVAMKKRGFAQKRLQLLRNITGTFRPDVLTALMGVSGAGKTTLLDVLAGRKTNGYIEGITKSRQSSLSIPPPGSGDLHSPASFAQSGWGQFKSSLWKQNLSYWRSPSYNLMHLLQTFFESLLFGAMYWNQGQEFITVCFNGVIYHVSRKICRDVLSVGICNITAVTPNFMVAAIVTTASSCMFNLFSGFFVPKPHVPKWWLWFYYLMPTSWTINGMLTSQYGDVQKEVLVFGKNKRVSAF
ncbi:hypothetical protein Patl1_23923 [Pistacia atlantica]|uniref:Uncharacterized protein n=1 Tax=Pistacia atlantica TaxID=434234 RepID=A0ACC0ZVH1_9ROSI|nr:hypothetical protein Patl1_23923 [Pistacia atlantica]